MFLVNYKKLSILLICFTVVFAEETTTAKTTIKTPKTPNNKQNGGNANQGANQGATNATATTTTKKADETTTAAPTTTPDNPCDKCLEVNHNNPLCTWNEIGKTDFHFETSGVCPCPVEGKDPCNVIHRTIRNIPALQAWSASVFLLSICIAGKINRVIRYYLYHCYFQKSPYVTHR